MHTLDSILRDEHETARLLFEVNGEALDDAVFERAAAYEDPLLACIKREIIVPLGRLETIEDSLWARIETFEQNAGSDTTDRQINTVVAAERVMPLSVVEALEQKVFERIERARSVKASSRFVWPLLPVLSMLLSRRASRVVSLLVVAVLASTGVFLWHAGLSDAELLTLITRAYGTAYRDDLVVAVKNGTTLACTDDGSLTLVNKAGSVSIHNTIALTVEKASERAVVYTVSPPSAAVKDLAGGKVDFSVVKYSKRQRFVVATPYFDIHVVGTRFVVAREQGDGFSAAVLEGTVRITSRLFGDTVLSAGQTLSFAPDRGGMRIESANVFSDEKDDLVSGAPERARCRLQVLSTPERASVSIDGMPAGITPFAVVMPAGTYAVSIREDGCQSIDTIVELQDVSLNLHFTLSPDVLPGKKRDRRQTVQTVRRSVSVDKGNTAVMELAKKTLGEAQLLESGDLKKAVDLYKQLASSPLTPPLYRETALFSLGRLSADRQRDTAGATSDFSRYLILYPKGMFAGEALLRLSELELTRNAAGAVDYFLKFLATSPDHPRRADAAYRLGLLLQQHNEYAEAVRLFTIALDETTGTRPRRQSEIKRMIAEAESLIESGRVKSSAR
ncbi:MAG: PEGA domain-containing protein [Chitinispirillaceae bacterium]|nr:PEGA domain-containing protein [Chitinispirillaceae bacterium]